MKRIVIGVLAALLASACNQSGESNKQAGAERFPGFTQIGKEGDSSRLYIDLNTVKQVDNLAHLKLVRVLDKGYVIQDAITDCHGSFKALEGVQYRDDGTSEKAYPGDEQPMPFAGKPAIVALVKMACDKAGMTQMDQSASNTDAEKPILGGKQQSVETLLPENTPDKLNIRAGLLEIGRSDFNSPPDSLVLNGKVVYKDEGNYLALYKIFTFPDHDAVLFSSNCGGTACQTDDFAFLVVKQGAEPKVVEADDFYAYRTVVKTMQDGNNIKLNLGYSGGKRKLATLDGEQLTIHLEDVPPQPLEEESCQWLHKDAMSACVEARDRNPDCSDPQGDFAGVIMRGVAAMADYPGFVQSGFDQQCQQACRDGKASDYVTFSGEVCSKSKPANAASAPVSVPEASAGKADVFNGCENLMATAGQAMECMKGNLQPQKDRLNAAYKTLFDALPADRQAQLEAEQKVWLEKRNADCGKLTDETPASNGMGITECIFKAVVKRSDELEKMPMRANGANQDNGLPTIKEGEDYANARKALLADGWQPYHSPDADTCGEGDTRCQDRPEMEACAGTGMANCNFLWKKDGKTIAVHTIGEGEPGVTGVSLVQPETSPSTGNQGEWYTCTAKPVLVVRGIPDVTGEKIGTVPEGGKVKVLEKNVKPDSISGRSGSWVKIEWQGGVSYVFDQFLEKLK